MHTVFSPFFSHFFLCLNYAGLDFFSGNRENFFVLFAPVFVSLNRILSLTFFPVYRLSSAFLFLDKLSFQYFLYNFVRRRKRT